MIKRFKLGIFILLIVAIFLVTYLVVEQKRQSVRSELLRLEQAKIDILTEECIAKEEVAVKKDEVVQRASWYDYDLGGNLNYSETHLTVASRDYLKGTCLEVVRKETENSVVVRVNDFGPKLSTGIDIDLSSYAFKQLAPLSLGVIDVDIYVSDGECK